MGQVVVRQSDFNDLQHAIAGLDVGRQRRHLQEGPAETSMSAQKKSERAAMTALQLLLLTDPAYAALRGEVTERLKHAHSRLAEFHLEAEDILTRSAAEIEALEARAGELPDGTKVFRAADGSVFTADGRELDAEDRADVSWSSDAPSYEEYSAAKQRHQDILDYRDAIGRAQARVDAGQATLENDQDNPTTADDLKALDAAIAGDLSELEKMRRVVQEEPMPQVDLSDGFNASSFSAKPPSMFADLPSPATLN